MTSTEVPICEFLNVDLEIHAQGGLEEFVKHVEPSMIVLHRSPQFISLELSEFPSETPEGTILQLVSLIEALPPEARSIWNRSDRRLFDVGVQAAAKPHSTSFTISSKTMAALAGLEAEIVWTVYAPTETPLTAPSIAGVGPR